METVYFLVPLAAVLALLVVGALVCWIFFGVL